MKIEGGAAFLPMASPLERGKAASTSFAQILASGRSVRSIRSERAFGFAETGIFGASRFFDAMKNSGTGLVRTIVALEPAKPFRNSILPSASQGQNVSMNASRQSDRFIAQIHISKPIFARASPFRLFGTAPFTQPGFETVSAGTPKIGFNVTPAAVARWKRARKRHVALSVSGLDDSLCITVSRMDIDGEKSLALQASFFFIAKQYGMTLQSVRLNNFEANIVFPIESESN